MDRIKQLCSYLEPCKTFADVACDHGYCAEYMLKNNLCESAVISDISEKCLDKAVTLLADYIMSGRCRAVCCDGLDGIDKDVSEVIIAGVGGEEILKILKNGFIPRSFVFQPMKNAELLRVFLLENGCKITADDIFTDGKKYYFVIKGERSKAYGLRAEEYCKAQIAFGRDSLNNPVFYGYLKEEIEKKENYLKREMLPSNRVVLENSLEFMRGIYNDRK